MKPVRFLWRIFENVPYHTAHTVLIKHASAHPLADVITSLGIGEFEFMKGVRGDRSVYCFIHHLWFEFKYLEGYFKSYLLYDRDRFRQGLFSIIELILLMKFWRVFKYRFIHYLGSPNLNIWILTWLSLWGILFSRLDWYYWRNFRKL